MKTLRVNDYNMAFVESGAGAPLLLVHGSFGDYRYWTEQLEPFGVRYRVISVSLRRCWPERWDGEGAGYAIEQHTADVAGFISALETGPVHLLGHSRGGNVAFRVAQHSPNLVRSLMLQEPGGVLGASLETGLPPAAEPLFSPGPLYAEAAKKIRLGEIDAGLKLAVDVVFAPGGWDRLPEWLKGVYRDNARTLLGQAREQRAPYERADAEAIRAPTLLVGGERSPATFHRNLDGLATAIGDVRQVVIPDAAHGSNLDNPAAFNREVLRFLENH